MREGSLGSDDGCLEPERSKGPVLSGSLHLHAAGGSACSTVSAEGKTKPVCECGAYVMGGNPSWDARAQSRGDEDHSSNLPGKWPENPRLCKLNPKDSRQGLAICVDRGLAESGCGGWVQGLVVFPHHLMFRQPWCLLTCLPSHTHR